MDRGITKCVSTSRIAGALRINPGKDGDEIGDEGRDVALEENIVVQRDEYQVYPLQFSLAYDGSTMRTVTGGNTAVWGSARIARTSDEFARFHEDTFTYQKRNSFLQG